MLVELPVYVWALIYVVCFVLGVIFGINWFDQKLSKAYIKTLTKHSDNMHTIMDEQLEKARQLIEEKYKSMYAEQLAKLMTDKLLQGLKQQAAPSSETSQ